MRSFKLGLGVGYLFTIPAQLACAPVDEGGVSQDEPAIEEHGQIDESTAEKGYNYNWGFNFPRQWVRVHVLNISTPTSPNYKTITKDELKNHIEGCSNGRVRLSFVKTETIRVPDSYRSAAEALEAAIDWVKKRDGTGKVDTYLACVPPKFRANSKIGGAGTPGIMWQGAWQPGHAWLHSINCGATGTHMVAHEFVHTLGLGHASACSDADDKKCDLMAPSGYNSRTSIRHCPTPGRARWTRYGRDHLPPL